VVLDRLLCLAAPRQRAIPDALRLSVQRGLSLDDPECQRRILAEIEQHAIELLIVDSLRNSSRAVDQGPREFAPLRDFLRLLIRKTGVAILMGHHDVKPPIGKADDRQTAHRASGGGIYSAADAPIHAERLEQEAPTQALLPPGFYKLSATPPPVLLTLTTDDPRRPPWSLLTGQCARDVGRRAWSVTTRPFTNLSSRSGSSGNGVVRIWTCTS
jgi:hypothetical protein